jgi:hypothetical protein
MANRIQIPDEGGRRKPDPHQEPHERARDAGDVAPLPESDPHRADYDDEIDSQRRLRWMTQVVAIPLLAGGLWLLALILAWLTGLVRCRGVTDVVQVVVGYGVALPATALLLWKIARGKLGLRRRWLNAILVAAMCWLGARYGWRVAAESWECAGAASSRSP